MASFRRSMPTVQRPVDEMFSDSSPSHKLSNAQSYSTSALLGSADSFTVMHKSWAWLSGIICAQRSSRPLERSKLKGQQLRRAFFHFMVCFMVGIFIGLTPLVTLESSVNLGSKQQAFTFEIDPPSLNVGEHLSVIKNVELKINSSLEEEMLQQPKNETSDATLLPSAVEDADFASGKLLIIVTPTRPQAFQSYYLNRLAHTLRLVPPPLLWIVVETLPQSSETAEILRNSGVMYRHLMCDTNLTTVRDGGVHQRNFALSHIEKHQLDGIVYFADDSNMYSIDLFEQMREISRQLGTWPVALLADRNRAILEGPVCNMSQVIGWHTNPRSRMTRRFHVDMSGFAFNSSILWDTKKWHRPTLEPIRFLNKVREGIQASTFMEQIVLDESEMQGLPDDCSRIMVWHLHLEAYGYFYPRGWALPKNLEVVVPLSRDCASI